MSKSSLTTAMTASIAFGQAATLALAAEKSLPTSWVGAKNHQIAFDAAVPVNLGLAPVDSEASDIFADDHVTAGPVHISGHSSPAHNSPRAARLDSPIELATHLTCCNRKVNFSMSRPRFFQYRALDEQVASDRPTEGRTCV